jgi:hypothetical protein
MSVKGKDVTHFQLPYWYHLVYQQSEKKHKNIILESCFQDQDLNQEFLECKVC